MNGVNIVRLTGENFNGNSLDNFILRQKVTKCWRAEGGVYRLLPVSYTEEWGLENRRKTAKKILNALNCGAAAFGAVQGGEITGFALLGEKFFGSDAQYLALDEFYVSEPFRRQGTGAKLFETVCREALIRGAKKLYISAHSAKESIDAYKKYGCRFAEEPDILHVEKEPFDLQLEYDLTKKERKKFL